MHSLLLTLFCLFLVASPSLGCFCFLPIWNSGSEGGLYPVPEDGWRQARFGLFGQRQGPGETGDAGEESRHKRDTDAQKRVGIIAGAGVKVDRDAEMKIGVQTGADWKTNTNGESKFENTNKMEKSVKADISGSINPQSKYTGIGSSRLKETVEGKHNNEAEKHASIQKKHEANAAISELYEAGLKKELKTSTKHGSVDSISKASKDQATKTTGISAHGALIAAAGVQASAKETKSLKSHGTHGSEEFNHASESHENEVKGRKTNSKESTGVSKEGTVTDDKTLSGEAAEKVVGTHKIEASKQVKLGHNDESQKGHKNTYKVGSETGDKTSDEAAGKVVGAQYGTHGRTDEGNYGSISERAVSTGGSSTNANGAAERKVEKANSGGPSYTTHSISDGSKVIGIKKREEGTFTGDANVVTGAGGKFKKTHGSKGSSSTGDTKRVSHTLDSYGNNTKSSTVTGATGKQNHGSKAQGSVGIQLSEHLKVKNKKGDKSEGASSITTGDKSSETAFQGSDGLKIQDHTHGSKSEMAGARVAGAAGANANVAAKGSTALEDKKPVTNAKSVTGTGHHEGLELAQVLPHSQ